MTTKTLRGFCGALAGTLIILLPLIWAADTAGASSQVVFQFQANDEARFPNVQPGDVRTIATYTVPDSLVGQTCLVAVTSTNDESVHINNFSRISTNGDSLDLLGTEDGVNGVHATDNQLKLGDTIVVTNHIGQRARGEMPVGTSVALTIGVTCTQAGTTTTTNPSTSTTSIPTTTTPTTAPPSSSTTIPDGTTSTTTPATSTTAPTESTTTTTPGSSTSSTPTTVPPVTTPETLPFTNGIDAHVAGGVALAAVAMMLLGAGTLLAARRS